MGTGGSKKEEQASLDADFLAILCGENGAIMSAGYSTIWCDPLGCDAGYRNTWVPRRLLVLAPFLGTAGPADELPCPQSYRRIDELFEALDPAPGGPCRYFLAPARSMESMDGVAKPPLGRGGRSSSRTLGTND